MKRVFFCVALIMSVVACDKDNDAVKREPVTEGFDTAIEANYSYGYNSEDMSFEYFLNEEYGYWGGFAHSKMLDSNAKNGRYENQYSAYNSSAASGDSFLLYYYDSYNEPCDIVCKHLLTVHSVKLNLSTYTYASITDEEINEFARVFTDGDYLKVVFTPYFLDDQPAGQSVECYVVDYRDGKRFVADNWQKFDLNLPATYRIRVAIETTDVGEWGANTPLYICMDDLVYTLR